MCLLLDHDDFPNCHSLHKKTNVSCLIFLYMEEHIVGLPSLDSTPLILFSFVLMYIRFD
eukprot:m.76527 g.76527  ORF g.76527 m.76527 type:complete len:59 (-) comp14030_c0_seq1:34-210(-)